MLMIKDASSKEEVEEVVVEEEVEDGVAEVLVLASLTIELASASARRLGRL